MNINAGIIDQRLQSVCEEIRERAAVELGIKRDDQLKTLAFVYLCVKTILDLEPEDAFECLTEGSQDFGVDALHVSAEQDGEFTVSLFQGKYRQSLTADAAFPEGEIIKLIRAVNYLFDPAAALEQINQRLKIKVEEVRSLIRDGYIPRVRILACNNGLRWGRAGDEAIAQEHYGSQVTWEHVNHDRLVAVLQTVKPVNDLLQLHGKAIVEDFNFSRVLVARISVTEIASLIERHGERLLERNIRRYLGLYGNRVNEAIHNTLLDPVDRSNFYFFNNGITLICSKFSYNALQSGDYQVRVENLQIINGGQTCMTIYKTLRENNLLNMLDNYHNSFVLFRLYQLPENNEDLVRRITFATNSQNPVDLRDLRANDERQRSLEMDIEQLGYVYRRKRADLSTTAQTITSGVAAEAVLSVWREKPHQAKFFSREHFGKLYEEIFREDLTGAQVVIAALLYRIAENRRKRPSEGAPLFLPYASCFIAMQMGKYLLKDLQCEFHQITHQSFDKAKEQIAAKEDKYFNLALKDIEKALQYLYGNAQLSLQQLSATFRRGDLIEKLKQLSNQHMPDQNE